MEREKEKVVFAPSPILPLSYSYPKQEILNLEFIPILIPDQKSRILNLLRKFS